MPPATDLLRRVASIGTLAAAWRAVRQRAGAPGIDRVSVVAFAERADTELQRLSEELAGGAYRPAPALRVYPAHDRKRPLAIPTVRDRIVQRAVASVLGPVLEPTFADAAFAYRKGRSVQGALRTVDGHLGDGLRYYLRTDVEKFFDRIDQERLLRELRRDVEDEALLRLVRRLVRARVLEGAAAELMHEGVPQGSALSPLLSNVYLRPFDQAVLAAGYPLVRYADDMLVVCRTHDQTADALDLLTREAAALGLRLGPRKTQRGHLGDGFTFLGVRFGPEGRGPARGALVALEQRAADLVAAVGASGDGTEAVAALGALLRRWERYHGPLQPRDCGSLAVALGCLLQLGSGDLDRPRSRAFGSWRLRHAVVRGAPGWLHVAAAEAWAAVEHEAALLWDAAAALAGHDGGLSDAGRRRLAAALGVSSEQASAVLEALARGSDELAGLLGAAGRSRLAAVVRRGLLRTKETSTRGGGAAAEPTAIVDDAVRQRLAELVSGAEGRHAMRQPDGRGHLRYLAVPRPLASARWAAHLSGEAQLAVYLLRSDRCLRVVSLLVRVPRRAVAELGADHPIAARLVDAAARLARAAEGLGVGTLLERLGPYAVRLWIPLAGPVPQRHGRALLVRICDAAGRLEEPLVCDRQPSSDHCNRPPGPLVPLPLGRGSARPGRGFITLSGRPVPDLLGHLQQLEPTDPGQVLALVRRGPLATPSPDDAEAMTKALLSDLPRAARVLQRCHLLSELAAKAKVLGHLEAAEVRTLYEVLGFLPGEGVAALRGLLALTGTQDERAVRRRVRSLPPQPVSCARIRGRLARVTVGLDCSCRFVGLRPGEYPTPLLHTLRPAELHDACAQRKRPQQPPSHSPRTRPTRAPGPDRPPGAGPSSAAGVERTSRRAPAAATGAPAASRAETGVAPASAVPLTGGVPPSRCAGSPDAPTASAGAPAPSGATAWSDALRRHLQQYLELRRHQQGVTRSMQRHQQAMCELLGESGLQRIDLDGASLQRASGGPTGWRLKVIVAGPGLSPPPTSTGARVPDKEEE